MDKPYIHFYIHWSEWNNSNADVNSENSAIIKAMIDMITGNLPRKYSSRLYCR